MAVSNLQQQKRALLRNRPRSGISEAEREVGDILPMGDALDRNGDVHASAARHRDWRKRMSDNIAWALLVYTGLQIWVTVHALQKSGDFGILPYMSLVVLVALIIPACRWFERRWQDISDEAAHDLAYEGAYKSDRLKLWILAIGLPFLITGLLKFALMML